MAETAPAQAAAPTTNAPATPANGATTGAPNAPTDQNTNSRGLPYYEKLRRDLRDTISKKRLMDKSMVSDEVQSVVSREPFSMAKPLVSAI
jgi:chromatin modification-related protein EAF6